MKKSLVILLLIFLSSSASAAAFIRGDINNDYKVDLTDGIGLLSFLFSSGKEPQCLESADINEDKRVDITDAIFLFQFLFREGKAPFNLDPDGKPVTEFLKAENLGCKNPHQLPPGSSFPEKEQCFEDSEEFREFLEEIIQQNPASPETAQMIQKLKELLEDLENGDSSKICIGMGNPDDPDSNNAPLKHGSDPLVSSNSEGPYCQSDDSLLPLKDDNSNGGVGDESDDSEEDDEDSEKPGFTTINYACCQWDEPNNPASRTTTYTTFCSDLTANELCPPGTTRSSEVRNIKSFPGKTCQTDNLGKESVFIKGGISGMCESSEPAKGCCKISCIEGSPGCVQTTEEECKCRGEWEGQKWKSAQDLCQDIAGPNVVTACLDTEWDKSAECSYEEKEFGECKNSLLGKMCGHLTILHSWKKLGLITPPEYDKWDMDDIISVNEQTSNKAPTGLSLKEIRDVYTDYGYECKDIAELDEIYSCDEDLQNANNDKTDCMMSLDGTKSGHVVHITDISKGEDGSCKIQAVNTGIQGTEVPTSPGIDEWTFGTSENPDIRSKRITEGKDLPSRSSSYIDALVICCEKSDLFQ